MTADSPKPDPQELLAPLTQQAPQVDPAFADRLEARLRNDHGGVESRRQARPNRVMLGAAAALVVVAAVIGLSQFRDEGTVSLEVSEAPTEVPAVAAGDDSGGEDAALSDQDSPPVVVDAATATAVPTSTPTTIPTPVATTIAATQDLAPTTEPVPSPPTAVPTQAPAPTEAPLAAATSAPTTTPIPSATPTPLPTAEPTPTPQPTPTVTPLPTPSSAPAATPAPAPTATPTATPTVEVELDCQSLVNDQGARVRCTWTEAPEAIDTWQLLRIRNGGPRQIIATMRPAMLTTIDDQLRPGDELVYAVQGVRDDETVVTSTLARLTAG